MAVNKIRRLSDLGIKPRTRVMRDRLEAFGYVLQKSRKRRYAWAIYRANGILFMYCLNRQEVEAFIEDHQRMLALQEGR